MRRTTLQRAICALATFTTAFVASLSAPARSQAELPPIEVFGAGTYVVLEDGGGLVGAEYLFRRWLSAGLSFGGFAQRPLRRNWLTRAELTARKSWRKGPVFEGFLSAGMRNIMLNGDVYRADSDGQLHTLRFSETQFAGSAGIGFGGSFERRGLPLRVVLRAELLFSSPYFQAAALDIPISLRVSYRIGSEP